MLNLSYRKRQAFIRTFMRKNMIKFHKIDLSIYINHKTLRTSSKAKRYKKATGFYRFVIPDYLKIRSEFKF